MSKKASTRKPGRPTTYTEALAQLICERIAEGESLRAICRDEAMPAMSTVMLWLLEKRADFRSKYALARELQADALFDETREIADNDERDWELVRDNNNVVVGIKVDGEHVTRSKLRVETRRWQAEKLAPKKYGPKVAVEASGPDGGPIQTNATIDPSLLTNEQLRVLASIRVAKAG